MEHRGVKKLVQGHTAKLMTDLGFKPRQSGFRATAVSHHTILLSLLPT